MRYLVTRKSNPVNMFNEFDSYLNGVFNNFGITEQQGRFAVDVIKNENDYQLTADLPGFADSEIDLQIENNILTISASHQSDSEKDTDEDNAKGYLLRERKEASYKRTFSLPEDIAGEGIEAQTINGQLILSIPRAEKKKPQQIKIKSA